MSFDLEFAEMSFEIVLDYETTVFSSGDALICQAVLPYTHTVHTPSRLFGCISLKAYFTKVQRNSRGYSEAGCSKSTRHTPDFVRDLKLSHHMLRCEADAVVVRHSCKIPRDEGQSFPLS